MIAALKGVQILSSAAHYTGYWAGAAALVLLALIVMACILARDAIRRWRCDHADVKWRKQQVGEKVYWTEICLKCSKTYGAKP